MTRRSVRTVGAAGLALWLGAGWVMADTLVLRNGRRVEGELVAVRGSTVEFEESSWSGSRTKRYDRDEVSRIELSRGSGSGYDGDDNDDDDRDTPPAGLREKDTSVPAAEQWTDTGISVRSGASVYFEARGKIRWGKDRNDDADGESGNHYNPNRPIPNRAGGALIARVGNEAPFFVGTSTGAIRMRSSGRLYLGINDDYLADNSGSFRVTVRY